MTHLHKFKTLYFLKSISLNLPENPNRLSTTLFCSLHYAQNPRFYSRASNAEQAKGFDENARNVSNWIRTATKEAQAALLDYLHSTRSLQFMDADHISKNSPNFVESLVKKFENKPEIGRSISRFLRYHPINEFEPFFESMGLEPEEFRPFLPSKLMFLSDDDVMMENYNVLCNFGVPRNKIGRIFKETPEVFRFEYGVLPSKLRAYEDLGMKQSTVGVCVACCPSLLVGGVDKDFMLVLEELKSLGINNHFLERHLSDKTSYKWNQIFELLCLFGKMGCSKEELGGLLKQRPGLLFEDSGSRTISLIVLLAKFSFRVEEMDSLFMQFPKMQVGKFVSNVRCCYQFLTEVEMEVDEIGKIVRLYPLLLGSCSLKKTTSILNLLNVGKKRICGIIKENPQELKSWVLGSKVKPLPNAGEDLKSQIEKTKFLLELGFIENTKEMNKALEAFRGKGGELRERFNCLVNAGFDQKDVYNMIRTSPQILNQSKDLIEEKIDFLVGDMDLPISTLLAFPSYLSYTMQRVKLRYSMYYWLRDQGMVEPGLAVSTLVATPDSAFIKKYVNCHPGGLEMWQKLKKEHQRKALLPKL